MTNPSPWILTADAATFQTAVIDRSHELPVIVDFWAAWCQPCRMLAPLLEKLADEYQGKFLLVKADTEQVPEIANQFNVQSIPAVFALKNGELVDTFVGLLPEPQLRAWLDRLLPTPAELLMAEGDRLAVADPAAAEAKYRAAAELAPNLSAAQISLAGLLLDQNRADEAGQLLAALAERGFLEPAAERLQARLDLLAHGAAAGDLSALEAAANAEPKNLERKLKLAEALAAQGQYEPALAAALQLVEIDRKKFGEAGRKIMVDIFQVLPSDSELTTNYRRRLSTALY